MLQVYINMYKYISYVQNPLRILVCVCVLQLCDNSQCRLCRKNPNEIDLFNNLSIFI